MGFFRKYIWGKRTIAQPTRGVPGLGQPGAENFNYSDNLTTGMPAGSTGAYTPAPGTAVLEVLSGNRAVLTMDTVRVGSPAPKGPYHAGGVPATHVRPGNGNEYQTFELPLDAAHPFKMPQSILDKKEIGGTILRIYWSCM